MSKVFKVVDYDIIYLSYDEPNAEKNLLIGNFLQRNILHYIEPEFLTDQMISRLESL